MEQQFTLADYREALKILECFKDSLEPSENLTHKLLTLSIEELKNKIDSFYFYSIVKMKIDKFGMFSIIDSKTTNDKLDAINFFDALCLEPSHNLESIKHENFCEYWYHDNDRFFVSLNKHLKQ